VTALLRAFPAPQGPEAINLQRRLNEEIKRRARVVRIFRNAESCLRLVRDLAVEMHKNGLEALRYFNMDDVREHKRRPCAWQPEPQTNLSCG
jgi:putative transposase